MAREQRWEKKRIALYIGNTFQVDTYLFSNLKTLVIGQSG